MRYVQVKEDGVVLGIDNKEAIKYGYGSMLNLRVKLTYSFAVGCVLLPTIGYYQVCVQMGISETEKCRK